MNRISASQRHIAANVKNKLHTFKIIANILSLYKTTSPPICELWLDATTNSQIQVSIYYMYLIFIIVQCKSQNAYIIDISSLTDWLFSKQRLGVTLVLLMSISDHDHVTSRWPYAYRTNKKKTKVCFYPIPTSSSNYYSLYYSFAFKQQNSIHTYLDIVWLA